jgi:hypothetical protein
LYEIRKEYEADSVTLKELAEQHSVKLGTVKLRAEKAVKEKDGLLSRELSRE